MSPETIHRDPPQSSRRRFLITSTTAGLTFAAGMGVGGEAAGEEKEAGSGVPSPLRRPKPDGLNGCPPEIREALGGPWPSISTPFTKDGRIDEDGLRRQIDFLIEAKAKAVVLTWGDSLFSLLTDDEIAEVTRIVVRHVNGRAYVVAATHQWWTGKAAEFAAYCSELGADMVMGLPPDWAGSTTVDQLVAYYAALGEHLPVMIVTNYLGKRGKGFSVKLCDRLVREVPRLMALKDDLCNATAQEIFLHVGDRWALSAGGQKINHLQLLPFGADGYLSTFIGFNPEITWRYSNAIEAGDLDTARAVIRDFDAPFFDYIIGCEGGFDAAIHAIAELTGISKRYRRPPYHSMTDAQMEELGTFLRERGMI